MDGCSVGLTKVHLTTWAVLKSQPACSILGRLKFSQWGVFFKAHCDQFSFTSVGAVAEFVDVLSFFLVVMHLLMLIFTSQLCLRLIFSVQWGGRMTRELLTMTRCFNGLFHICLKMVFVQKSKNHNCVWCVTDISDIIALYVRLKQKLRAFLPPDDGGHSSDSFFIPN